MSKYLYLLVCIALITGCSATQVTDEYPKIQDAIVLQAEVVNDPLFTEVLTELESNGAINWGDNRTTSVHEDLSQYPSNLAWALEQFSILGPYSQNDVFLWRKWNPKSDTIASTLSCTEDKKFNTTKLNKWTLDRDVLKIANTLVHEKGHSFCLTHPSQDRTTNQCDFTYISGDLAEAILVHRQNLKTREFDEPMCPALCASLEARGMLHGCK